MYTAMQPITLKEKTMMAVFIAFFHRWRDPWTLPGHFKVDAWQETRRRLHFLLPLSALEDFSG